ncbi:MAG: sugar phosphate isomerase/epimerase family protein [Verrucomicrobiota bacterium]|jgi:hexulose-6-phosphate isomerase
MSVVHRREFLKTGTGALVFAALAPGAFAAEENTLEAAAPRRSIKKGIMWATVGVKGTVLEKMKAIKEAGFEGTEMMSHMDQDEVLRARDATGLTIPSVCGQHHWAKPLSHPDPKVRAEGLEALKQTLRDAKRYGASSVLLVPAVVSKEIAYDDAYQRSQAEIRKALPLAEELGVKIACENVWNYFLLSPLEAVRYVDEFKSKAIGWHFDVGNIINYSWPEQWIGILGARIQKFHIKEFSRKKRDTEGLWKGFDVRLLEGDNNWPAVMKAVDEIGYHGWVMTEQPGGDSPEGLKDLADRLGKVLAS